MSRIGNSPINIPDNVEVGIKGNNVLVKGVVGELQFVLPKHLKIKKTDKVLQLTRDKEDKKTKSLHGLYRSLIYNAVCGVNKPWEKRLEVVGTGYNVKMEGEDLVFKVGYSYPVIFNKVEGVIFRLEGNNKIIVLGADKQLVGQVAYRIKMIRKPDVYKGKGIRYEGEKIKIKPGKKAKAGSGGEV